MEIFLVRNSRERQIRQRAHIATLPNEKGIYQLTPTTALAVDLSPDGHPYYVPGLPATALMAIRAIPRVATGDHDLSQWQEGVSGYKDSEIRTHFDELLKERLTRFRWMLLRRQSAPPGVWGRTRLTKTKVLEVKFSDQRFELPLAMRNNYILPNWA